MAPVRRPPTRRSDRRRLARAHRRRTSVERTPRRPQDPLAREAEARGARRERHQQQRARSERGSPRPSTELGVAPSPLKDAAKTGAHGVVPGQKPRTGRLPPRKEPDRALSLLARAAIARRQSRQIEQRAR